MADVEDVCIHQGGSHGEQHDKLTSVHSACCVHIPAPAGERNHWAFAAFASEGPPLPGWLLDGRPGSSGSRKRRELWRHLGTGAAASPCVSHMTCSPEINSG